MDVGTSVEPLIRRSLFGPLPWISSGRHGYLARGRRQRTAGPLRFMWLIGIAPHPDRNPHLQIMLLCFTILLASLMLHFEKDYDRP